MKVARRSSIGVPCGVRAQACSQASRVRASSAGIGEAFGGDDALERGEPVVIIGLAGIGIAGGLRFFDFVAEGGRPFFPGEQAARR